METTPLSTWANPSLRWEHQKAFQNARDQHRLTERWVQALAEDERLSDYRLRRVEVSGLKEHEEVLEILKTVTRPEDADAETPMERVEQTVWVSQAWALRRIFEKTPKTEWPALRNLLEHVSWNHGRELAGERWGETKKARFSDISGVWAALLDSPFVRNDRHRSFLALRRSPTSIEFEQLTCPHHVDHIETLPIADELCDLQNECLRGFVYRLNPRVTIETMRQTRALPTGDSQVRCLQTWRWNTG